MAYFASLREIFLLISGRKSCACSLIYMLGHSYAVNSSIYVKFCESKLPELYTSGGFGGGG